MGYSTLMIKQEAREWRCQEKLRNYVTSIRPFFQRSYITVFQWYMMLIDRRHIFFTDTLKHLWLHIEQRRPYPRTVVIDGQKNVMGPNAKSVLEKIKLQLAVKISRAQILLALGCCIPVKFIIQLHRHCGDLKKTHTHKLKCIPRLLSINVA